MRREVVNYPTAIAFHQTEADQPAILVNIKQTPMNPGDELGSMNAG
jgi:hypothetical protein